ncbi:trypsin-like serine protease [Corynebacterium striatum]|nr:trypsin-like serine protease [Corynebacterium striatum]QQE52578.1 trypsin-like serine protease [Corynebacterium striatum]
MSLLGKKFIKVIVLVVCYAFLTPSTVGAEPISPLEGDTQVPSLQASDTNPVVDNRIAALVSVSSSTGQERRTCTASSISADIWLTARHCSPKPGDLLRQVDGDEAKVKQVFFMSVADDLALLKVGKGIEANAFELPISPLQKGDSLTLIGYGASHEYSSIAQLEVKNFIDSYPPEIGIPYHDLVIATTTTPSRTCEGDSGSPVYSGNTIYAIHTAGGSNPSCTNSEGSLTWLSELSPERVHWIESICKKGRMPDLKTSSTLEGMSSTLFSKE